MASPYTANYYYNDYSLGGKRVFLLKRIWVPLIEDDEVPINVLALRSPQGIEFLLIYIHLDEPTDSPDRFCSMLKMDEFWFPLA